MPIPGLGLEARTLVLQDRPSVLSSGRKCALEGYSFHWDAGRMPYMVHPDVTRIDLEVENLIPIILGKSW